MLLLEKRYGLLLGLALGVSAALAWARRFVTDDAFISFRYARHLAEGHGLVFNPGERVEGYTNFLWTVVMAAPHAAGLDPVAFSYAAGPILAALALYFTGRMALAATGSKAAALLTVALLAVHPSFAAWSTGGLETQLLTCLLAALTWLALAGAPRVTRNVALSLLAAAALMTRLDSAFVAGIALAAAALRDWQAPAGNSGRIARLVALAGPAAALVGAWLMWKLGYYGALLPNTFHAKVGDGGLWGPGVAYLAAFFNSYLLWPALLLVVLCAKRLAERAPFAAVPLLAIVAAHLLYLAAVGGDFMEFRMLVPILPMLYTLIAWSLFACVPGLWPRAALGALLLAGHAHHALTFEWKRGIEPVALMIQHLHAPGSDWVGVGSALARELPAASGVRIALTPIGAIPYYSGLPTLDMLGLTEPWVARNGMPVAGQPGHRRLAPYSYLLARGAHLVIAHPWVTFKSGPERSSYGVEELRHLSYLADPAPMVFAREIRMVEVPLDGARVLVALYLTRHPAIDALIAAGRWRALPLSARRVSGPAR